MLHFTKPAPADARVHHRVYLTYHQRVKARQRIVTVGGVDAGVFNERGSLLKDGQKLLDDSGQVLEVLAKEEVVSVASTSSLLLFSRACYHVGNRHAEVQIEELELIYLKDHVMDQMLLQLGLSVNGSSRAFTPENGAYSGAHGHNHDDYDHKYMSPHKHEHNNEHAHAHGHDHGLEYDHSTESSK